MRIEARELHKRFGDSIALDGLSFAGASGEILGLIGPDGAGKTTAMRILCGLLRPDSGLARVAGFDCVTEPRGVKEHVGYMPQRFSLYPDLSVSENLRFFAELFGVRGPERERLEDRLMRFSRLEPFRDRRAAALSGGMKQKLALSCTLIHRPEVLVLDEPTTGVDPVSRQEFWNILRELKGDGLALLVSTPYMDEAGLCDRVVLVHEGRAIASGRAEEIPARVRRRLLRVTGAPLSEARGRILRLGLEAHRFGDRLHVFLDASEQENALRASLAGLGMTIEAVPPSIEDAFVELTAAGRDAPGS
jgi:ABC-2 type transport system ATP-binding protein